MRTVWTAMTPDGVLVYYGENKLQAVAVARKVRGTYDCFEQPEAMVPQALPGSGLPYPWCRDPETCRGKGYCPKDPNCGE